MNDNKSAAKKIFKYQRKYSKQTFKCPPNIQTS